MSSSRTSQPQKIYGEGPGVHASKQVQQTDKRIELWVSQVPRRFSLTSVLHSACFDMTKLVFVQQQPECVHRLTNRACVGCRPGLCRENVLCLQPTRKCSFRYNVPSSAVSADTLCPSLTDGCGVSSSVSSSQLLLSLDDAVSSLPLTELSSSDCCCCCCWSPDSSSPPLSVSSRFSIIASACFAVSRRGR